MSSALQTTAGTALGAPPSTPGTSTATWNPIHQAAYYARNVTDIGQVAAHLPTLKNLDRLALNDCPGKHKLRHVGPSPWPVDSEEPQPGDRKAVEVTVGMSHQLVGLFGRGVETNWMIGLVIDRKWQLGVVAIDR